MPVGPRQRLPGRRIQAARHGRPDRITTGNLEEDPTTLMDASALELIILPAGIVAVLFAVFLARDVLSRDTGTKEMEDVAGTIFEGAVAFIRRQYTTIGLLALVASVVIGLVITL